MGAKEGSDLAFALEPGLVDVEVHAVDAFDFQGDMAAEDFGGSPRYTHGWLRSSWSLADRSTAVRFQLGMLPAYPVLRHDRSLLLYILSV
jgi:hypothetical protein